MVESRAQSSGRRLRAAMVGGGQGAFIGAVHRLAQRLDGDIDLVAGAMHADPEIAVASALELGIAEDRAHRTWMDLLEDEKKRPEDERIDFVTIVTPNFLHAPIALAFVQAGINVVCDKPLCLTEEEAAELVAAREESGVVFAVTYNYTGYPMVREARARIANGEIGQVRRVFVEYHQGWLATRLEDSGQQQASWRTDPSKAGVGGAVGDIGSHAENLVSFVTGLEIESVVAECHSFLGRPIDDDTQVMFRMTGDVRGTLTASQICIGDLNGLALRVHGDRGSLYWGQENPNHLTLKSLDGPDQVLHRGADYLSPAAADVTRIPAGHPEAFIEAFANVYRGVVQAVRAGEHNPDKYAYPGVEAGAAGVKFIHRVVQSSAEGCRKSI